MALGTGSPAINAGSPTLSATRDRLSVLRSAPDIGAFEWTPNSGDKLAPAAPPGVTVE